MKINKLTVVLILFLCTIAFAQEKKDVLANGNNTILWKISGNGAKTSYILGTYHLLSAEWLYGFPEIMAAIDSSQYILNEAFSSDTAMVQKVPVEKRVKALSILTLQQYATLDSFFVARVNEGIKSNVDAENMTVGEMASAIWITLVGGSKNVDGITQSMDQELFNRFEQSGKKGDRLDRIPTVEFDSSTIREAKQYLSGVMSRIEGSDHPKWTIYGIIEQDSILNTYKTMQIDYKFTYEKNSSDEPVEEFDYVPLASRNKNWLPKIEYFIAQKNCLIAVGLAHLFYKTGLIMLLREKGYKVEPVKISSKMN